MPRHGVALGLGDAQAESQMMRRDGRNSLGLRRARPYAGRMSEFDHPVIASLHDTFDGDRRDLGLYLQIAEELGARSVVDIGCGTGVLALLLAERGLDVVGVDPAGEMLNVARAKPGADRVRWVHGDATMVPALQMDLATMTGNVAQVFVTDAAWSDALASARNALRLGGTLVFETRVPARGAWERWTREHSYSRIEVPGIGLVEDWVQLDDVALPLVTFTSMTVLPDGSELDVVSTLRFRERGEIETSLRDAGFELADVRDAPDRPGHEWVFMAHAV
jgi:SAM-dependent methyltransferase